VEDPSIDLVDIVTPNYLHKEMALAAIAAGKHVYCEKPLAPTAAEAHEMYRAAAEAGVTTLAGFNFLRNPAVAFARELVEAGEIGEVYNFHGTLALDAADPSVPYTWRYDRKLAGAGALGDLGAHVIEFARSLVGDIERVCGLSRVVVPERPEAGGPMGYGSRAPEDAPMRAVENDDITLFMAEFAGGAVGTFECNRAATGRAHDMSFTVTGSKGALRFDQQGAHALQLFLAEGPKSTRGFRSVNMGPGHGDYGRFWPFPGLNVGIHELKVIEVNELLSALAEGRPALPGFEEAWQVCRVIDAVERSADERRWVEVAEI
jgi:predicted dehydrogenase